MKNVNFIVKTIGLALVAGLLIVYSTAAANREKQLGEYEKTVAEIEANNEEVIRRMIEDTATPEPARYADGVYEGRARGFGGEIEVKVTIENGRIAGIEIVSARGEDRAYFSLAGRIIESIIEAQSADVDAVSGATFSSTGIKNAVRQALSAAER